MSGNNVKLRLKIVVDKKAKRVLLAESDKNFVDFLFHLLSLPLATVAKLLNDKGMSGCLGSVYRSFYSLGPEYFDSTIDRTTVFKPNIDVIVPTLSLAEIPSREIYKCPNHHDLFTYKKSQLCPQRGCSCSMASTSEFVMGSTQGFVTPAVVYMVMDNLEVQPMSISVIRSHVSDFDNVQEKVVEVGVKEALKILKASLETSAVLTTVFLGKKKG